MFKKVVYILLLFISVGYSLQLASGAVVTCIATTTASIPGYYGISVSLSSSTNATVGFSSYPYKIMCKNLTNTGALSQVATSTGCPTYFLPMFNVSSTLPYENAHVEDVSVGKYPQTVCVGSFGPTDYSYATVTTKLGNCDGYGTTLFSAPASFTTTGNTHIGEADAYPMKRCLTLIRVNSISVSYSSNSVGFGTLSSSGTRYATADGLGTTTPLTATSSSFYIDVSSTGNTGYIVSLEGATLTNQSSPLKTIAKIGGIPAALTPGIEQFGISATTSCVNPFTSNCILYPQNPPYSSIASPYDTDNYAYAGDLGVPTILGNGVPDDGNSSYGGSRYHIKMAANISPLTSAGTYKTNLTVVVTSEF